MLKIVQITSNPKKKRRSVANKRRRKIERKRKVVRAKVIVEQRERIRKSRKKKRKVIRVRRNPPCKTYQTIITGLVKTREKRFKTYYFTGKSFVRNKEEAKIYPGSLGKVEAKRILNWLPPQIESLSVERV